MSGPDHVKAAELTVRDLVVDLLYYDRKEDDLLFPGVIESVTTKKQIIAWFTDALNEHWSGNEEAEQG